jgi:hypothetical protein
MTLEPHPKYPNFFKTKEDEHTITYENEWNERIEYKTAGVITNTKSKKQRDEWVRNGYHLRPYPEIPSEKWEKK